MESFHGRFRDECLNQEVLWTLTEARVVVADFRHHDNHSRPHGKLGHISPVRFAAQNPRSDPGRTGQINQPNSSTKYTLGELFEWLEKMGLVTVVQAFFREINAR